MHALLSRKLLRKGDALLDGRMTVKNELDPGVGLAFREVEFRQLFHAGDEGGAGRYGPQRVGIRLALHGARV